MEIEAEEGIKTQNNETGLTNNDPSPNEDTTTNTNDETKNTPPLNPNKEITPKRKKTSCKTCAIVLCVIILLILLVVAILALIVNGLNQNLGSSEKNKSQLSRENEEMSGRISRLEQIIINNLLPKANCILLDHEGSLFVCRSHQQLPYDNCRSFCDNIESTLAASVVRNQSMITEMDRRGILIVGDYEYSWIGLSRGSSSHPFVYIDGVEAANTPWYHDQPNNCVAISSETAKLHDLPCNDPSYCLCQLLA